MVLIALRRAAVSGLTKHLKEEEMGFLGREELRETRMLMSENLHEGTPPRQLSTNNDQNTACFQSKISSSLQYRIFRHFYGFTSYICQMY